jgi:hypothetical protein
LPASAAVARRVPRAVATAAARRGRLRDLDPECATVELSAIERCDSLVRRLRGLDFNKAEAARLTGIAIRDDSNGLDAFDLLEELAQSLRWGAER